MYRTTLTVLLAAVVVAPRMDALARAKKKGNDVSRPPSVRARRLRLPAAC